MSTGNNEGDHTEPRSNDSSRGGYYKVGSKLGFGAFSYVSKVADSEGNPFALKKSGVSESIRNPMLRHEVCAMLLAAGHPFIPKVHAWGCSQYFEYLVTDFLGKPLIDFTKDRKRYHLKNCFRPSA